MHLRRFFQKVVWKHLGIKEFVRSLLIYYLVSAVLGNNVHILLLVDFSGNLNRIYLMNRLGIQSENTLELFYLE